MFFSNLMSSGQYQEFWLVRDFINNFVGDNIITQRKNAWYPVSYAFLCEDILSKRAKFNFVIEFSRVLAALGYANFLMGGGFKC